MQVSAMDLVFFLQVCAFGELDFAHISLVAGMSLSVAGLWMEVKLRWQVLADRMYTKANWENT